MSEEDQAAGQPSANLDLGPSSCGSWPPHRKREKGVISFKSPWQRVWKVDCVEGMVGPLTQLVAGAGGNPRDKQFPGACSEDKGLF